LIRPIAPRAKREARKELVEGIVAFCLRAVGASASSKKAGRGAKA
jgi:hypothetical protein